MNGEPTSAFLGAFLAALPPERCAGVGVGAVAASLAELLARAHAAWPASFLDDATFTAYVAVRLPPDVPVVEALAALRAADLYLAAACAHGVAEAMRAFAQAYFGEVDRAKQRFSTLATSADDIRQEIAVKLFVKEGDAPPRVAQYAGRGDLRGWFRAVAVRQLLDASNNPSPEVPLPEAFFESALPETTEPELAHLRATYREELRWAFGEAAERLGYREKNVLRYVLVERLSMDQLAAVYGVHRATAGRWVEAAREAFSRHVRSALKERLRLSDTELESIVRVALSHVEITVERHLRVG
jgi:RNA polymerase sigma-70 factor (ECF subfamily)